MKQPGITEQSYTGGLDIQYIHQYSCVWFWVITLNTCPSMCSDLAVRGDNVQASIPGVLSDLHGADG